MSDYDVNSDYDAQTGHGNDGQNAMFADAGNTEYGHEQAWDNASSLGGMEMNGMSMGTESWADMNGGLEQGASLLDSPSMDTQAQGEVSFTGKYSQAEIDRLQSEVDRAKYEVKCRDNDVRNWESKVSLNDTKEGRANGDYDHAVRKLNAAKSDYNRAVSDYNNARSKLNNAL